MGEDLTYDQLCIFLKKTINHDEINLKLYEKAFIHKSFHKDKSLCNERLEFIGDSVLNLIIAHYLYEKFPDENEGFLTRIRTKLVSGESLSLLANQIGFNKFIKMNEKGLTNKWYNNAHILEDVFEAFIGAMYVDKGLEHCRGWVIDAFESVLTSDELTEDTNYKDVLMKTVQNQFSCQPIYKIHNEQGPEHNKNFVIQVFVNGLLLSTGIECTKKKAEQSAARKALQGLGII